MEILINLLFTHFSVLLLVCILSMAHFTQQKVQMRHSITARLLALTHIGTDAGNVTNILPPTLPYLKLYAMKCKNEINW